MGAGEIVIEQCNAEVLEKLRLLDKTIAECNRLKAATMDAYSAGRQWDFSKVRVNLDLDSGIFTVEELPPAPPA